jgi:hypothetical protein
MAQGALRNRSVDADALKILKESGILNPDVTLEEMFKLSEKLAAVVEARGSFIFRDFVYRPCKKK